MRKRKLIRTDGILMMLGLYNITGEKSRIRKVQRRTVVGVSPKKDSSDEPVDYINLAIYIHMWEKERKGPHGFIFIVI